MARDFRKLISEIPCHFVYPDSWSALVQICEDERQDVIYLVEFQYLVLAVEKHCPLYSAYLLVLCHYLSACAARSCYAAI